MRRRRRGPCRADHDRRRVRLRFERLITAITKASTVPIAAPSRCRSGPGKPARQRAIQRDGLAEFELGDLPKRLEEVAVVEHEHVWQFADRAAEILERSGVTRDELLLGHVVPALEHAHRDALVAQLRRVEPDKAEDAGVAARARTAQELELVADRIREVRLW